MPRRFSCTVSIDVREFADLGKTHPEVVSAIINSFHPIKPIVAVQFLGYDAKVTFESEAHKRVLNSDGVELSTLPEIMKAHEDFYSSLFAEESVDLETQNHLLSFVSRSLSDNDRDDCEGALLLDEATEAVGLSNNNKAPGPDGLSVGFYLTFWFAPLTTFSGGFQSGFACVTALRFYEN